MKIILLFFFLPGFITCFSQSENFIQYKDSVNRFNINIPTGWNYGVNKNYPDIKLIAVRKSTGVSDKVHENFNLNVINKPNSSLDREYKKLIGALKSTNNFNLIESDSIIINGHSFKWFIESHKNESTPDFMNNYVFIAYKEDKTYILTFVSFTQDFEKYRSLFLKIAKSFIFLNP